MYAILDPVVPFIDFAVAENLDNRFLDFVDLFTNPVLANLRTFSTATSSLVGRPPGWTLENMTSSAPRTAILSSPTSVAGQTIYLKMVSVESPTAAKITFTFSNFVTGTPGCLADNATTNYIAGMTRNGKETMHVKILPTVFGFNCPVYSSTYRTMQYISGFMTERTRNTEYDQTSGEIPVYFVDSACNIYGNQRFDVYGKYLITEDYGPWKSSYSSNINFTRKDNKDIMYPLIPLTVRGYEDGWTGGSLSDISGIYQTVSSNYITTVQNQQPFIGEDGLPYRLWKCSTASLNALSAISFGVREE